MLIDPATRRPVRLPASVGAVDAGREPVFGAGDAFSRLRWPDSAADETPPQAYRVMRSQIDLNGHVNNVHYANWMLESVPEEAVRGLLVSECEIAFRSETLYGERVESCTAPLGGGAFAHRVRPAGGGPDHILARTQWRAFP